MLNIEEITSSGTPQQQQPRKRSCRPWGCYQRPGSPSFPRKIRRSAAFGLGHKGFCGSEPDIFQNRTHIIIGWMMCFLYYTLLGVQETRCLN